VLCVLWLGGCDLVFSLDPSMPGDAGIDLVPACFEDTFEPGSVDLGKWEPYMTQKTNVSVDGELAITLDSTGGDAYAGALATIERDLTGATTEVEVSAVSPIVEAGADAFMKWTSDTGEFVSVGVDGSSLYIETSAMGQIPVGAYERTDPTRFWQLEHAADLDTLRFVVRKTSGEVAQLIEISNPLDLTHVRFELSAGTYNDFNAPGQTRFDNFRMICP